MKHKIKYKLDATKREVRLTLTVPNDYDALTWLHDCLAIKLADSGRFIGDVYRLRAGESARSKGKFATKFKTHEDFMKFFRS